MNVLLKKLHIYLGLLNFCALFVFGIAGLTATFESGPEGRAQREPAVRYQDFPVPASLSDPDLADSVYQTLRLPLANPVPKGALRRNDQNQLALDFYTVNGISHVTVLENENKLRIETVHNNVWRFLNNVHAVTTGGRSTDMRIRLWSYYNEFAIWSLLLMPLTGVYLWLASRPRFRWAQVSLAAGCGGFLLLYIITR